MRRFHKGQVVLCQVAFWWLCATTAYADTFHDIQQYCLDRSDPSKGIHWIEECIQTLFTAEPYRLTVTSVAPGAGSAAFGPAFGLVPRVGHYEFVLTGLAAVSTDGSSIGQAQLSLALPTRSLTNLYHAPPHTPDVAGRRLRRGSEEVRASITLRVRRINAREQDFYGLGESTSLAGHSSYGLQQTELYAGANNPLTSWSSAGLDFSFLMPRVPHSIDKEFPAIQTAYTEASAPGLTARGNFLRYEPYLTFKIPPQRSLFTTARAGYAIYQSLGDPRYSFRQISANSKTTIPLLVASHNTPSHRSWLANVACPSLRSAERCSVGTLILSAQVTASYTPQSHVVPFYFDPTLGGSDINLNDTLRGYVDYRFRGPSALLFQAEYRHPVWGPVGVLAFYDKGKVAMRASDLSFSQMRHDLGLGIYLRAGNREIVRLYFGFGTEEGSRTYPKFPNGN